MCDTCIFYACLETMYVCIFLYHNFNMLEFLEKNQETHGGEYCMSMSCYIYVHSTIYLANRLPSRFLFLDISK